MVSAPSRRRAVSTCGFKTRALPHGSLAWENVIFTDTERRHLVTEGEKLSISKETTWTDGMAHYLLGGRARLSIHLQPEDGLVSMGK